MINLRNGKWERVARGKKEPEIACNLARSYLECAVKNPQIHIDHPS